MEGSTFPGPGSDPEASREPFDLPALVRRPDLLELPPQPAEDPSQVWTDIEGKVLGWTGRMADRGMIYLVGVGEFLFDPRQGDVEGVAEREIDSELLQDAWERNILPHVLQARGTQVLHASAVTTKRGVVAFCGVSGSGKSTVAYGLSRRGYDLWADDAVALGRVDSCCQCLQLPFRLRLPGDAAMCLVDELPSLVPRPAARPVRGSLRELAGLILLRRLSDADRTIEPVQITRVAAARAFPRLLEHAYWFDTGQAAAKRVMIETYLRLAAAAPVLDCAFASDLDRLPGLLNAIESALVEP